MIGGPGFLLCRAERDNLEGSGCSGVSGGHVSTVAGMEGVRASLEA